MKNLIMLVGPPGSGKSILAKGLFNDYLLGDCLVYINQDSQGKKEHLDLFMKSLAEKNTIIVDRMNFNKEQRNRYLKPAKEAGYTTKIIVLHENYDTCLKRCKERENHETIKDEATAKKALHFFFTNYERVEDNEADTVERKWPEVFVSCVVSDLDNTLANNDHREYFLQGPGKKNWKGFFDAMGEDKLNIWCGDILRRFIGGVGVVICSARPDDYRKKTEEWLAKYNIRYDHLIMRSRGDFRRDDLVKEILLEYELKTRYNVLFWIDDRKQVIDKIRSHGITVLDCAGPKGDF